MAACGLRASNGRTERVADPGIREILWRKALGTNVRAMMFAFVITGFILFI